MKKIKKRQFILLAIFLILVIYLMYDRDVFSRNKSAREKQVDIDNPTENHDGLTDFKKYANVHAIKELEWNGKWERDPFFYPAIDSTEAGEGLVDLIFGAVDEVKPDRLKLTGISWHGNSGYALIDGSIVREGNKIGGHEVKKITHNYVILTQGTQIKRLEINE